MFLLLLGVTFLSNSISQAQEKQVQPSIERQSYQNSEADKDIIDLTL